MIAFVECLVLVAHRNIFGNFDKSEQNEMDSFDNSNNTVGNSLDLVDIVVTDTGNCPFSI